MGCKSSRATDVVESATTFVQQVNAMGGPSSEAVAAEGALSKQQAITHIKSKLAERATKSPGESGNAKGAQSALRGILPGAAKDDSDGEDDVNKKKKKTKGGEDASKGSPRGEKARGTGGDGEAADGGSFTAAAAAAVVKDPPATQRANALFEHETLEAQIRQQRRRNQHSVIRLKMLQVLYDATQGFANQAAIPSSWKPSRQRMSTDVDEQLATLEFDVAERRRDIRVRGRSPSEDVMTAACAKGSGDRRQQAEAAMVADVAQLDGAQRDAEAATAAAKQQVQSRKAAVEALKAKVAAAAAATASRIRVETGEDAAAALAPEPSLLSGSSSSSSSKSSALYAAPFTPAETKIWLENVGHLAVNDKCVSSQKLLLLRKMCEYCGLLSPDDIAAAGKKPMVTEKSVLTFDGMPFGTAIAVLVCVVLRNRRLAAAHAASSSSSARPVLAPIVAISIGDCTMSDTGAKHLAVALNDMQPPIHLRKLSLIGNSITSAGAVHLIGALISNPHITDFELDLSANELGCDAATMGQLGQYLAHLKAMKPGIVVEMPIVAPAGLRRTGSIIDPRVQ